MLMEVVIESTEQIVHLLLNIDLEFCLDNRGSVYNVIITKIKPGFGQDRKGMQKRATV